MTLQVFAAIALVAYLIYSVSFIAEGHKPRGSVGLRTLGFVSELLIAAALIWAIATS